MIAFLAATVLAHPQQTQPAKADKDAFGPLPRVYRAAFEDRTSMVLFRADDGLWFAFNPHTCAMQKVWSGEVEWRGKVYDFSQNNSRARGEVHYELPSTLLKLEDGKLAEGWKAERVAWRDGGWAFDGDGAKLTSPVFSFAGYQNLFVKFDERSRKGPLRVNYTTGFGDMEINEHFYTTTHGSSQTAWQWNSKQLTAGSIDQGLLEIVQEQAGYEKSMKGLEVFGDALCWSRGGRGEERPPMVARRISLRWRGYQVHPEGQAITLFYDLEAGGETVRVTHQVVPAGAKSWREQITLSGSSSLPINLRRPSSALPLKATFAAAAKSDEWIEYSLEEGRPLTLTYGVEN